MHDEAGLRRFGFTLAATFAANGRIKRVTRAFAVCRCLTNVHRLASNVPRPFSLCTAVVQNNVVHAPSLLAAERLIIIPKRSLRHSCQECGTLCIPTINTIGQMIMKTTLLVFALIGTLTLFGCDTTSTVAPEPTTKNLVSSATVDGLTVELYADKLFVTGYNPIYVRVLRGTTVIKDAHVGLDPLMDMGMMKHSCPTIQPGEDPNADGLFEGAVIYTMAGTTDEWTLAVTIHDHTKDVSVTAEFPVAVAASTAVKMLKIDGQGKTIITLMPRTWKVGMNDAEFMVHTTADGFVFTPRTDLTPYLTPTMPSMGHGSNGNVDPTHKHDGTYSGKVNLTMTGDWDLEFGWMMNDTPFKVNFPILVP
jgi:hypothetical protein